MRVEDLLSTSPSSEQLAEAMARLPPVAPEALAELRQRLTASERSVSPSGWPALLRDPHARRDTRYAPPPTSHRPLVGPALVLAKRAFRLAFQPFINEILRRQVEFNEAILDSLARLYEQQQEQARLQAQWRRRVEERLEALAKPQASNACSSQEP